MKNLAIVSILLFPMVAWAAEKVKPIEVVKLDRKDPVAYEKAHRPTWVEIPEAAVARLRVA